MGTILIIANGVYGPKLRSDLITIGHAVHFVDKARLSEVEISQGPDIILLDVDTPEEDVGAICRALRDRERRSPILAIVDEERVRGLDFSSGIDDFVVKPYSSGRGLHV